ncbi:hypothetical protein BJX65DRAFT_183579 [Aspergillus insuetus]
MTVVIYITFTLRSTWVMAKWSSRKESLPKKRSFPSHRCQTLSPTYHIAMFSNFSDPNSVPRNCLIHVDHLNPSPYHITPPPLTPLHPTKYLQRNNFEETHPTRRKVAHIPSISFLVNMDLYTHSYRHESYYVYDHPCRVYILPIHAERQFVLPRYANEQRGFVAHYLGTYCGLSCFGIWMVHPTQGDLGLRRQ